LPNHILLREAQQNFADFGAIKRDEVRNVIKPTADVKRLDDWSPTD
jgi:hypothetical protein